MSDDIKYVKDQHGHVYIFVPAFHTDRIGAGLEFTEFVAPSSTTPRERVPRTLQELRELAAQKGFVIDDETPFAKAQNMYAEFIAKQKRTTLEQSEDSLAGLGVFDDVSRAPS